MCRQFSVCAHFEDNISPPFSLRSTKIKDHDNPHAGRKILPEKHSLYPSGKQERKTEMILQTYERTCLSVGNIDERFSPLFYFFLFCLSTRKKSGTGEREESCTNWSLLLLTSSRPFLSRPHVVVPLPVESESALCSRRQSRY